jgi:hypothetical protein
LRWRGQFLLVDPVPQSRQFPHPGAAAARVNLLALDNESKFIGLLPGRFAQRNVHDRDSLLSRGGVAPSPGASVALKPIGQRLLMARVGGPGQESAVRLNVATGSSVKEAFQAGATSSIGACSAA